MNPVNQPDYRFLQHKVVLWNQGRLCETGGELLNAPLLREVVRRMVAETRRRQGPLGRALDQVPQPVDQLLVVLELLSRVDLVEARKLHAVFSGPLGDRELLIRLVNELYDWWRRLDRIVLCRADQDPLDQRPYRTFHQTVEQLNHLIRGVYRDILSALGHGPRVYRQVAAGAKLALITRPLDELPLGGMPERLDEVPCIRQILLDPPLVVQSERNKRKGGFTRLEEDPLGDFAVEPEQWLLYPARVGKLRIWIYLHEQFWELGIGLANLLDLLGNDELDQAPDACLFCGVPGLSQSGPVYWERPDGRLVGALPLAPRFGYFGYLKKTVLTLHNVAMMRSGAWPFHGALVEVHARSGRTSGILVVGESGTGKSETLEALARHPGVGDIRVVADDMGSVRVEARGDVRGYGTEIGAFLRLDDLAPATTFGVLDRAIFMNPHLKNARVVIPVSEPSTVVRGIPIDWVLYADNHSPLPVGGRALDLIADVDTALGVFREGLAMAKGTTGDIGLYRSPFANPFGPPDFPELHEELARKTFEVFFARGVRVGVLKTRLGLEGMEQEGPERAAEDLMALLDEGSLDGLGA